MIKAKVIGSGSRGNCTAVNMQGHTFFLDAGLGVKRMVDGSKAIGGSLKNTSHVFVTHEHGDHLKNAEKLAARTGAELIKLYELEIFEDRELVPGVCFSTFELIHDVRCVGLKLTDTEKGTTIGYVTDTYEVRPEAIKVLTGCTGIIIEFNHEVGDLLETIRPQKTKIRSMCTHMNNKRASEVLSQIMSPSCMHVVAFHISEAANSKETIRFYFDLAKHGLDETINPQLTIAAQSIGTGIIALL